MAFRERKDGDVEHICEKRTRQSALDVIFERRLGFGWILYSEHHHEPHDTLTIGIEFCPFCGDELTTPAPPSGS